MREKGVRSLGLGFRGKNGELVMGEKGQKNFGCVILHVGILILHLR